MRYLPIPILFLLLAAATAAAFHLRATQPAGAPGTTPGDTPVMRVHEGRSTVDLLPRPSLLARPGATYSAEQPSPLPPEGLRLAASHAVHPALNTVYLPFTVMGSHLGTVTRPMTVNLSNASNVNRLWLRLHSGG